MFKSAKHYRSINKFYVRKDHELVTWVYYWPDKVIGEQYVVNDIDIYMILNAEKFTLETKGFFHFLGSCSRQYYYPKGTSDFKAEDKKHRKKKADFVNCDAETMSRLIALAHEVQKRPDWHG